MAQKQFKIGLSNTDKQNMAQDVYERVLALTFNEYDTTTQYEIGDFVVYNDQLYKCIGATSGAWDNTKWQLATLNDLLTDIESAVAFVNDKANVDGNYPTMTVGMADNLTPYDESAGDDQDTPFILQATGTGNGSQPDFATGSAALMKEKQGNTVVVNQLFRIDYDSSDFPYTYTNGVFSYNETPTSDKYITNSPTIISGHKYLVVGYTNSSSDGFYTYIAGNRGFGSSNININGTKILTATSSYSGTGTYNFRAVANVSYDVSFIPLFIDLTQWFNGDIPQDLLDNPSNFFRYYQGSLAYNAGTLVNANGRYIKCIGMNQWDEELRLGYGINAQGQQTASANKSVSKNLIPCIPNKEYFMYCSHGTAYGGYANVYFYDANQNFLGIDSGHFVYLNNTGNSGKFTTPANACFMIFVLASGDQQYNNDISINLYYEDEPRCLTYEPYEVLTNNDTGTEVLRSAGSVKDSKAPDGTITRRVGSYTFTGNELWAYYDNGANSFWYCDYTVGIENPLNTGDAKNICSNGIVVTFSTSNIRIYTSVNPQITSSTNMNTVFSSGTVLNYELAEPITEQGTPYSENLVIDDFGSMDFGGTNGVPQGALIFYPVDYKAFVDTLYKYTDGTPSDIALKSDLSGFLTQQDLSSEITDKAGLTYSKKKAIKTGNLVTLTIVATNNTASAIPSNTTLFQLSNSLTPSVALYPIVLVHSTIAYSTINDANGNVSVNAELGTGKAVYINICYCL